jgi:hypothetical protein
MLPVPVPNPPIESTYSRESTLNRVFVFAFRENFRFLQQKIAKIIELLMISLRKRCICNNFRDFLSSFRENTKTKTFVSTLTLSDSDATLYADA